MYQFFIRPLLFQFDPEKVHYFTFSMIKMLHKIPGLGSLIRNFYHLKTEIRKKGCFD